MVESSGISAVIRTLKEIEWSPVSEFFLSLQVYILIWEYLARFQKVTEIWQTNGKTIYYWNILESFILFFLQYFC